MKFCGQCGTAASAVQKRRYILTCGPEAVHFGREVFDSPHKLLGMTKAEKQRFSNPCNCAEHKVVMNLGKGTLLHVKGDQAAPGWEVLLMSSACDDKIKLIKVVRSFTGLGLKDAKELIASAPAVLAVLPESKSKDAVKAIEGLGGRAEARMSDKMIPPSEVEYDEKSGIHIEAATTDTGDDADEGPFKRVLTRNADPELTCLFSARKGTSRIEWQLDLDTEFSPDLLTIFYSTYYGPDDMEYRFLDHLEYDGRPVSPVRVDDFVDSGEDTLCCFDGKVTGMAMYNLNSDETLWLARFDIKADWIHYGCDGLSGMDRDAKVRHREMEAFDEDKASEALSLLGARLDVYDVRDGSKLYEVELDPAVESPVGYEYDGVLNDWMVDFDADGSASYLCAFKRCNSKGLCSRSCIVVHGALDPSKLKVKWNSLFCNGDDRGAPAEWTVDRICYDGESVVNTMSGSDEVVSAMYFGRYHDYVEMKDRGEMCPQSQWGSWILRKSGREMIDLWGDWID